MFQNCNFLIIKSKQLTQDKDLSQLLLANNVANIYIKDDFDNSKNYMDPPKITHIISNTIDFIEHDLAIKSMIPIVTPSWVYDSISSQKMQNIRTYNPDPAYFFKDCFICCADNLPPGDKELIYAAAQAFGGGYLDNITKYTTHLIAMDISNEKSILASSIIHDDDDNDSNGDMPNIKIVLPHWIDHCITMGKKLNEDNYLLPDAKILHDESNDVLKNEILPEILNDSLPPQNELDSELQFFKNKKFYINSDFNLSQRSSNAIKFVIERHGGSIIKKFDVSEIDIYLGKYRQGDTYKKSCASNRIIVGNLQWLYFILASKSWTLPLNSNILYYPQPSTPLDGLQGLKISITNYSGEARSYLSKLITIMGGVFTKTLTRDNDYLVCGKAEGKKFDAALNKWVDSEGNSEIKVVNHLWLEDCYVQWHKVDSSLDKYKNFGDESIGMEPWVGRAHLDQEVLKQWYEDEEKTASNSSGNIDDSMSEDESTQSRRGATTKEQLDHSQTSEPVNVEEKNIVTPSSSQPANQPVSPISTTSNKTVKSTTETTPELNLSSQTQKEFSRESSSSPIIATATKSLSSRYGERSAAKKATAKLHDNMSDLIAYQEMTKSSRKMKSYMDQLEGSLTPSKKRKHNEDQEEQEDEDENENDEHGDEIEELSQSDFSKTKKKTQYHIIAIMSGCEQIIELSKSDVQKLRTIGIKIVNDIDNNTSLNTLIAPKILRTEKFLRSLSKVDKIIHPNYLVNIINHISSKGDTETVFKEYRIDDYSLDKVNKNTNLELGYSTNSKFINGMQILLCHNDKKGKLFQGMNFNLSSNLNGGIDVISRVLKDHGMNKYKEIKTPNNLSKSLIKTNYKSDEKIILIANKKKDTKLINNFKKSIKSGIILEWDWCVKSIFKMELQDFKKFQI
ncbi:hypothetical protein MG5_01551 [Candida albicans P57072]|nr:hypothetical protein MG5_01551 [Candida albicans P57072]